MSSTAFTSTAHTHIVFPVTNMFGVVCGIRGIGRVVGDERVSFVLSSGRLSSIGEQKTVVGEYVKIRYQNTLMATRS